MRNLKLVVLPACIALVALTSLAGNSDADDLSYPVVFSSALELRNLGLVVRNYSSDSDQAGHFGNRCYDYGQGSFDISFSNKFFAKYKAQGFSRRSLCMALVSQVRFDPESGERLPTYIISNAEEMQESGDDVGSATVSHESPLAVPRCFWSALPYSECEINYDMISGKKVSAETTAAYKQLGQLLEDALNDPARRDDLGYRDNADEGMLAGKSSDDLIDDDHNPFADSGIRKYTIRHGTNATFYDYSEEFPKGYGYALHAEGAAGPDPGARTLKQALERRRFVTQASLQTLQRAVLGK